MTKEGLTNFRLKLLGWFSKNKRNLPWRENPSWYRTYLSEVILQQTTVEQGLPYFEKFIKHYPTIEKLSKADEQQVLFLWAGLGYYTRARNLLKAAKIIVKNFNAHFPGEYKDALKIPGIGPYSAAAILSIAFRQPYAAIDGNIIRVVSRIYSIKNDIRQIKTVNTIKKKADFLLDKNNPGDFNEALMELGSIICTPKNPHCTSCPVSNYCIAFKSSRVDTIPFKSSAKAKQKKYQIACILQWNAKILLGRRPQKGLLAGMWELPAIEVSQKQFENGINILLREKNIIAKSESTVFRHIYSHIDLKFKAITAKVKNRENSFDKYIDQKWIELGEFGNYAIHNAHKKIFDWYKGEIRS